MDMPRRILIEMSTYENKLEVLNNRSTICVNNITIVDYELDGDKLHYEKIHTKFCKFVLNVSKFTSNLAVRAELGRYPLYVKLLALCAKYWARLKEGSPNKLLNKAYKQARLMNAQWIQNIKCLFMQNGLGNLFNSNGSIKPEYIQVSVRNRLEDQYVQYWNSKSRCSSTLATLHKLKSEYSLSTYLTTVSDIEKRKSLTKVRCGILFKRYQKSPVKKLCPHCPENTYDIEHVFFHCHHNKLLRDNFNYVMSKKIKHYHCLSYEEKLEIILNVNAKCQDAITAYVYSLYCEYK